MNEFDLLSFHILTPYFDIIKFKKQVIKKHCQKYERLNQHFWTKEHFFNK